MELEEGELILAIIRCSERGLIENEIITTRQLTEQLNQDDPRSREWSPTFVGQIMKRLGFESAVTPITYYRGWRVSSETLSRFRLKVELLSLTIGTRNG